MLSASIRILCALALVATLASNTAAQAPAAPEKLLDQLLEAVREAPSLEAIKTKLTATTPQQPSPFPAEHLDFFETRVRPVLAEYCHQCHGPETQKAGMRLDSREAALLGRDTGPVVTPGDSANSRLTHAIQRTGDIKMPPDNPLPPEAVEALIHWIDLGAPWPAGEIPAAAQTFEERIAKARATHWAFKPVVMPQVPTSPAANPIDAFVQTRLAAASLAQSPRADKRALIRRATFDLTGLPPTPEEVATFLAADAPDAFSRVVERLLASPRYGERWGRYWLDLARYSDTKGYVFQEDRNFAFSHTYRDYVIRAFNEDLPYDQFLMQQLAADQLDLGDDKRPLAAMGYLTLGRRFIENIDDITDDRIDVVTRGMLGLTVSCARCHDHKFDPIPAADYYSLYGVFRSSREPGEFPLIKEPDPNNPQYQEFVKAVAEKEGNLNGYIDARYVELMAHTREKVGDYLLAAYDARDIAEDDPFRTLAKDRGLHWQLVGRWRDYLKAPERATDPIFSPYAQFAVIPAEEIEAKSPELAKAIAANEGGAVNPLVAERFKGDAPKTMAEVATRIGDALKSSDKAWYDLLAATTFRIANGAPAQLPTALPDANLEALRQALYAANMPASIPPAQVDEYLDIPTRDQITNRRVALQNVKATHPGRPDRAMVLNELDKPFDPYVFKRGKSDQKGDDVPRQFLAVLSNGERKPFEHGSGRLDLAKAIASKDNPLTARVFVNRVWMYHFGKPLVGTPSDFGLRSEAPTHPELLDYLAARFMEDAWSIKNLHRLILSSETYQQASALNTTYAKADPENKLLWRQNQRRLDFESLRDSLLAVSNKLDLTMGGPSVEISEPPFTPRRSVYARIERQNLPAVFRTFDFATPDTHSPRRYQTTVPQQALFMMNSPFVVEQARAINTRPEVVDKPDTADRIRELYALLFQRDPSQEELAAGERFLQEQDHAESPTPPPAPAWSYGYGSVAIKPIEAGLADVSVAFTPLPFYSKGTWKGGEDLPDATLGWVSLNERGGHPGHDPQHAAIRRWTAPYDALVSLNSTLRHETDKGDGVTGYIIHTPAILSPLEGGLRGVSSLPTVLWQSPAFNTPAEANRDELIVHTGDTLDFIVTPNTEESFDGFNWAPHISLLEDRSATALAGGRELEWHARTDFAGPPAPLPDPLTPWEEYAQVLLLTNEFIFVD